MAGEQNKIQWIDRGWQPAYIGYCPNKTAWNRFCKDTGETYEYLVDAPARCNRIYAKDGRAYIVIQVDPDARKREPIQLVPLFLHECVHVWQYVREVMADSERPTMENEAYSVQAIFQELSDAYKRAHGVYPWGGT